jgi:hypothetical protein
MCSVKLTMVGDELMVTNSSGLLWEELDRLAWYGAPLLSLLLLDNLLDEALLLIQLVDAMVVPTSGERIWPELGFQPDWVRENERERNWGGARVWRWRGASYRPRRVAARILTRPIIRRLPPSCFPGSGGWRRCLPGGSRLSALTEPVSWPGPKWVGLLGCGGGLRPGNSLLSYFFSFCFFSFCFIYWFQVIYLNSNISTGFWIRTTFEINFYV